MGDSSLSAAPRRAVFLDRDGVINRALVRDGRPYPPAGLAELEILPDAPGALAELKKLGFLLLVITNQPDVARGAQSRATVEAIHAALGSALPLDDFFVCCHDNADGCDCRKPKPGLLLRAAARHGVQLTSSFLIGDRWRDIEAGQRAGCITLWIDRGYAEPGPSLPPAARVESLGEAAAWIIRRMGREREQEREIRS